MCGYGCSGNSCTCYGVEGWKKDWRGSPDNQNRICIYVRTWNGKTGFLHWRTTRSNQYNACGRKLWPTQPYPVKPAPFARQRFTENDLNNIVADSSYRIFSNGSEPISRATCSRRPRKKGRLFCPAMAVVGNGVVRRWDPETNILYVNANEMAWVC